MLYLIAKIWVRVASHFYCSRLNFDRKNLFARKVPLILACSHPNSFLDAIVMGAYHDRPLHFLARGDAFKNPRAAKIMRMLKMIPIYRLSEGKENLDNNKQTFKECMDVFKRKGVVLIFSEGLCVNEWKLRPLKKGTARIAWMCWKENDITDMVIQPAGINYDSFDGPPKVMDFRFEKPFGIDSFELDEPQSFYKSFNVKLTKELSPMVLEKDHKDLQPKKNKVLKLLLALPALAGYILHRAFYVQWRNFIYKKTKDSVFYDSVLFTSLMLIYPIIVFIVCLLTVLITGNPLFWWMFILIPFTAWSYKEFKVL